MEKQSLNGPWEFRQAGGSEWLPAQVPGGVHTDLLTLGRIPDPFDRDNELDVLWVAESDWEYRRRFTPEPGLLSHEHTLLVFEGLDTLADVYLNGRQLGSSDNMFIRYEWNVSGLLQPGENEILIYFHSPVRRAASLQAKRSLVGVEMALPGASHIRKAPCQFGWDWGPMLPPIGIWKPVTLQAYSGARLSDLLIHQQHRAGAVDLSIQVDVQRWSLQPLSVRVQVTSPSGEQWQNTASLQPDRAPLQVEIPNPQLWWPAGYGGQPLYQVQVELLQGETVIDQTERTIGLRTAELRQEPDEWGTSFTFVINGLPVFAKGSNWIPADTFPTRLSDGRLDYLLRSAAASHQNMLRVWGGGLYEDDRFYDLCDRYGIMVWQDFVFACSIYPLNDPAFLASLREEVRQNIRRLRHHPSLVLWCGNNEIEEGWEHKDWDRPEYADLKEADRKFFFETLPGWVAEDDPDHPYWPSSPSSNTPYVNTRSNEQGDAHYWEVWHGRLPFTAYRTQYPRFMSEFGFQSLPPLETIESFTRPEDRNLTSYIMEHHQRSLVGNGLIISQMAQSFRIPKDFPSLVYLSMVLQAEGIRYGVEHWRRNKQRVSGTLYWQLNDCWPVISWSSIDYFGRWKALHYMARRFYAPVMLSILDQESTFEIHVTCDLPRPWQGEVRWELITLDGQVLQSGQAPVSLAPLQSAAVEKVVPDLPFGMQRRTVFIARLFPAGQPGAQPLDMRLAAFVPDKYLELANPQIQSVMTVQDGELQIDLHAGSLARFVELKLKGAGVIFSDNYFDLPPGETRRITAPLPAGWTLEDARRALQIFSLYDSYA